MSTSRVLILHGLGHHRPREHWLWWLAEELRLRRVPVQYPQFPSADEPVLEEWIALAVAELEQFHADPSAEHIVVAHSLGTVLWQHLASRGLARADRALLVAPPSLDRLGGQLEPFGFGALDVPAAIAAVPVTAVMREADFYRTTPAQEYTAGWDAEVHILPGEGHLNIDDGHGPFPAALDWVLKGSFAP
jgi:predicted alpha/beta hydrolase family esterase